MIKTWKERKEAWGATGLVLPTKSYMQAEIDELRAALFVMTADRDSWAGQVADRIDDVLRFSNEVDRLKAQPVQEPRIDFEMAYGSIYMKQRAELAEALAQPVQPAPKVKAWYKNPTNDIPVQLTGVSKMQDGCCHKTVVTRCKDCSFNKEPIDKK